MLLTCSLGLLNCPQRGGAGDKVKETEVEDHLSRAVLAAGGD